MTSSHRFVRPGFRRWSTVVFVFLLPFVVHSVWDYVESRRLRARIEALVRSGQPITARQDWPASAAAEEADRYYRAAAALGVSAPLSADPGEAFRLNTAIGSDRWPPELIAAVRQQIERNDEGLALVDRAASLPFEGFMPGSFSDLTGALMTLMRLCEYRAAERALAGNDDGAFDSLYSAVRLVRATGWVPSFRTVRLVVQRAHPSPSVRARLLEAVVDLDRPDRFVRRAARARASALDEWAIRMRHPHWEDIALRPWAAHQLVRWLDGDALPASIKNEMANQMAAESDRVHCARQLIAGDVVDCSVVTKKP